MFTLTALIIAGVAFAKVDDCIGEEFNVTASDGTLLSTCVAFPDPLKPSGVFTALLDRSPYGHEHLELVADIYVLEDRMAVEQDMRGTEASGGDFTIWHKAASDTNDTLHWLKNGVNTWLGTFSASKFGQVGASADGLAALGSLKIDPPALPSLGKFIIFAASRGYSVVYPGGGWRESLAELWIETTIKNATEAAQDVQIIRENEYPGPWWDALNLTESDWKKITAPQVHWAGWYDIFLGGQLYAFNDLRRWAPKEIANISKLVIDPLGHCQSAASFFQHDVILGRVTLPILLSLELFKGETPHSEDAKAITFYLMGPNESGTITGEYWVSLDEWPEYTPQAWYLSDSAELAPQLPSSTNTLSYHYDPSNPVPSLGGSNLKIACGPLIQNPIENRSDVLLFTTPAFSEDTAMVGAVNVTLFVSSTANDTDFTAKLTDVYPDGSSHLLQDGMVRMRWRGTPSQGNEPRLITPGQIYEITVELWSTAYVVNKGHSLRIAISSSNAPRFSVNPNTGIPLANVSSVNTNVTATNTIHFGGKYPSSVSIPTVPLSKLPEFPVLDVVEKKMQRLRDDGKFATIAAIEKIVEAHEVAKDKFFDKENNVGYAAFPFHPLRAHFGDSHLPAHMRSTN